MGSATALLVPLKSFSAAKKRLGSRLNPTEKEGLMRALASAVLGAVPKANRWVVGDDSSVATFAVINGAQFLWRDGGLNSAVQSAAEQLAREGFGRVVVAHGDLADPSQLALFFSPVSSEITTLTPDAGSYGREVVLIATDRHADGSNVLSIPTGVGFTFAYGNGSLARHQAEALRCGLRFVIIDAPNLGLDVDTPEDLELYRRLR